MRNLIFLIFVFNIYFAQNNNYSQFNSQAADTSQSYVSYLLQHDTIFKERWITNDLFVYYNVSKKDLSDTLLFTLVNDPKQFKMTWYGKLYWGYGMRWGKIHHGLDIFLTIGDTIYAAFDGIIRYAQFNKGGYGNCIIIRHLNGLETLYGHMSKLLIGINTFVKAGQPIGLGGSTGRSDGPHLHFETRYKDFSFNPYFLIDSTNHTLKSVSTTIYKKFLYNERYPVPGVKKTNYKKPNKNRYYRSKKKKTVKKIIVKKTNKSKSKKTNKK